MARQPRQLQDGAAYHVMCQINRKKHMLKELEFKDKYLEILKRAKAKYKCEIRNFCIMDNHVHLEIWPKENNLSLSMQWISGMFTREYNKMTGECGRLWRGRFKSKIIVNEKYERTLIEYISYNPSRVNHKIKIGEYKYSGIYHIIRNDFSVINKPNPERLAVIDEIYRNSRNPDYFEDKLRLNLEYGFYPGKPGKKRINQKAA